jgi:hypothetical protein
LQDTTAGCGGSREADALDERVRRQRGTRADAGHGVHYARRQHLVGDFHQAQSRERRLFPRLDHHGISRSQCRRGFLGKMNGRPIKRQNCGDDPIRLIHHPRLDRPLVQDLAMQRVGKAGEIIKAGMAERHIESLCVAARLADFASLELGQLIRVRPNTRRHLAEEMPALTRRHMAPGLLVGASCIAYCSIDNRGVGIDDARNFIARCRLVHREGRKISGLDKCSSDESAPQLALGRYFPAFRHIFPSVMQSIALPNLVELSHGVKVLGESRRGRSASALDGAGAILNARG